MTRTLVLVPGSFSTSDMYDPVVLPLREKGYSVHALDPPCYPLGYAKGKAAPSMLDDAKFVSDFVEKLADQSGEEVVIMAHSYGGIPATQSLEHITATARAKQGKKGGVTHMAYMTALAPALGANLMTTISGGAPPTSMPPMHVDADGWMSHADASATGALCFNSLPAAEARAQATRFGRHSSVSFADALTYPGYQHVSVSWFFCDDDKCIVPEVQQAAIDRIEESWKGTEREGKKVHVRRVKCDHVPIFSAKEEVEAWIVGLLK
ncbi:hypothetical protein ACEQ8H_008960 [Pleosporales sp. CAS-2024a]